MLRVIHRYSVFTLPEELRKYFYSKRELLKELQDGVDENEELDGLIKIASVPIAKQDFSKVTQYMVRKLEQVGLEIRLNCKVDKGLLQNEFADYEVVISNGIPLFLYKHLQLLNIGQLLMIF